VVQRDVRVQRAHEEEGGRARVEGADAPGLHGPPEVVADGRQPALRRAVGRIRVERHYQLPGTAVHVDRDVLRHDVLGEGDEVLGDAPQHFARIGRGRIDIHQLEKERRRRGNGVLHRRREEGLLRFEVPENRGRRHAEDGGNVGQRSGIETLLAEDAPGSQQHLVPGNAWWASHL